MMSQPLFESDFNAVSDKEWIEKIEKDLRGASFDSLKWKLEDGSLIEPFYTSSRNTSHDNEIHNKILQQLKNKGWKIIQDLRNAKKEEIKKALDSEVDKVILDPDHKPENKPHIEYLFDSKSSLDSIDINDANNQLYIDLFTPWLKGELKAISFSTIPDAIFINGSYFHNAGASDQYELALTLSLLNEYLHELKSKDVANSHIIIELGVGINFYLSIAKFRASRILIQKLIDLYAINITFELRARTSEYWNSHKDQHTNLLRHTTMGLSAVLGGVDGLIVTPFEEANSHSLRLARNIQHLLKNESYLDKVNDMMAGSYLIEELTLLFIDKSWNEFKNIENKGGFISVNKTGEIKEELLHQHRRRVEELKEGKRVMIGVNKYQKETSETPITTVKEGTEAWQINKQILSHSF